MFEDGEENLFDDDSDYDYYSSPQRLGKAGITVPCTNALIAVLTSAFRPEKIIAVIGDFGYGSSHSVLFVLWDWLYTGVTIIPDGFGTHGGEGGGGLSTALGLIKFYQVPLLEIWVDDQQTFRELAQGTLTKKVFHHLRKAQSYNWNFYPVNEVQKVKSKGTSRLEVKRQDYGDTLTIQLP